MKDMIQCWPIISKSLAEEPRRRRTYQIEAYFPVRETSQIYGVPPKDVPVLINLVWELGYQAGTAEMLADE